MAPISKDQPLVSSVLDRLIDDDPGNQKELPRSRNQVLRELKDSVRRDLENLLNTRWRCSSWPPNLDELELSLVNYGIPDFTGASFAVALDREELRRIVEKIIRTFEPRFKTVRVELLENEDRTTRQIRFRIDAMLHSHPAPEPVVFDSHLEPSSNNFSVRGETR